MKTYSQFVEGEKCFMADVLSMKNTIHAKNKDELVKSLERHRARGGVKYSTDVLRAARSQCVKEGLDESWVNEVDGFEHVHMGAKVNPKWSTKGPHMTVHHIVDDQRVKVKDEHGNSHTMNIKDLVPHTVKEDFSESELPQHLKDLIKKHGLEGKMMKTISHSIKDVTPKGYGPDEPAHVKEISHAKKLANESEHKIGDRVKSFDFPGKDHSYMVGKVSRVDDSHYHIDVDKAFFKGDEIFDFPAKIKAPKGAHAITGAVGVVKESEELDEGNGDNFPIGWEKMSPEAKRKWQIDTHKRKMDAIKNTDNLAASLKADKEKSDAEGYAKMLAQRESFQYSNPKYDREFKPNQVISFKYSTEEPKKIATVHSLFNNGDKDGKRLKVKDKDGRTHVINYHQVNESFDDEHGTGDKHPSSAHARIKKIINNIEAKKKPAPAEEERDSAHAKHIERLKKAKEEYLKSNPNSIYKKD
jgi:hypothetical protein